MSKSKKNKAHSSAPRKPATPIDRQAQQAAILERQTQRALAQAEQNRKLAANAAGQYIHDPVRNPPTEPIQIRPLLNQFNYLYRAGDYQDAWDVLHQVVDATNPAMPLTLLAKLAGWARTDILISVWRQLLTENAARQLDDEQIHEVLNLYNVMAAEREQHRNVLVANLQILPVLEQRDNIDNIRHCIKAVIRAYLMLDEAKAALPYVIRLQELAVQENDEGSIINATAYLADVHSRLGQTGQADEQWEQLDRHIEQADTDSHKLDMVIEALNASFEVNNPQRGQVYYKKIIELGTRTDLQQLSVNGLQTVSHFLSAEGRQNEAIPYHKQLAELAEQQGSEAAIEALGALVDAYEELEQTRNAIPYYERIVNHARAGGDRESLAAALEAIVNFYSKNGQEAEAIPYLEQWWAEVERDGDEDDKVEVLVKLITANHKAHRHQDARFYEERLEGMINTVTDAKERISILHSAAESYLDENEFEPALAYLLPMLQLSEQQHQRESENDALIHLVEAYCGLGQNEPALTMLQRLLTKALATDDPMLEAFTNREMGAIYYQMGQYEQAIEQQRKAQAVYEGIGANELAAAELERLAEYYTTMGQPRKARECRRQAAELREDDDEDEDESETGKRDLFHLFKRRLRSQPARSLIRDWRFCGR